MGPPDCGGRQQPGATATVADLDAFHIVTVGTSVRRIRQERGRAVYLTDGHERPPSAPSPIHPGAGCQLSSSLSEREGPSD